MASKDETSGKKDTVKERILLCRERYKKAEEADRENRQAFTEDMKFANVPGNQWDERTKSRRKNRAMHEYNRTRTTIKRVINGMRGNPVAGKVRGTEDADKDIAEIYEGQIRNIANTSNFDAIRDNAAEYQVGGGYAGWRIVSKYSNDSGFDQDLLIEGLRNPLCLLCDPSAFDQNGRDAKWWILTDKMPKETYKATWPKAKAVDFEVDSDDQQDWEDDDTVRVAEHWYQVPADKTIILLSDGRSIGEEDLALAVEQGATEVRRRTVRCYEIYSAIYSGDAELSPPAKWPGKYFPWVRVYGEYIVINGKAHWNGLTRHVKDAQRSLNLSMTSAMEAVARAPLSQVWATAEQAKGLAAHWASANDDNLPAMIYNTDPKAPGPPVRIGGAEVPVAFMQNAQMMGDEMKADSGIFDASLGQQSNETSGRAINARQQQGELATFNFQANMANAIKYTWEILVDLVPKVYDTARTLRILGADDVERYVRINQPDENGNIVNDLSIGKYDVIVSVGANYATKQAEAVDAYTEIGKSNPQVAAVATDLIIKGMGLPYGDEIAERIRATYPPQLQQIINKDSKQSPEMRQAMAASEQAMQQVQEHGKMIEAAAAEATQLANDAQADKAAADKAKADVQVAVANLKVQEAEFARDVAKFQTDVAKAQLQLMQQAQAAGEDQNVNEREQLSTQVNAALADLQERAANHMEQATQLLQQAVGVVAETGQVAVGEIAQAVAPQRKTIRTKRVNGKLIGEVTSEDGTTKIIEIGRDNGELVGTVTPTIN